MKRSTLGFLALVLLAASGASEPAVAHGERNQEPFLRMRTTHWYDVTWSADKVAVNDEVELRGKVRIFSDWPKHLFELKSSYLNLGTTGPVFVKLESYMNDTAQLQSTDLEYGRDYAFALKIKARLPGRHHVHPMLNVEDAGPVLGPGKFIEVTGDPADFVLPAKTIDGIEIPNLETWAFGNVLWNHAFWIVIALFWLGWWFRRRPVMLPRFRSVSADRTEGLVGAGDRMVAAGLVVATLFFVAYGAISANAQYPRTSALQGGRVRTFPLPEDPMKVEVRHRKGTYDVPGRALRVTMQVTNRTDHPIRLGEFTAANLRFVNPAVPEAVAGVPPGYPEDLLPRNGLEVDDDSPLAPGQTREMTITAADKAWETERLASLMGNPDSSYGALLFFFDDQGNRRIAEVSGPALPVFTSL